MMKDKIIFLIGFMGVGKTTIGKKISNKLSIPFIDLDQLIENKFQITINAFFEKYGEATFRKEETKMLEEVISNKVEAIVSVGGGLPCYNDNMKRMNAAGLTCYLQRPAKELFQRLKNSKGNRPLLKELNNDELFEFIENKLREREVHYNQASLVFNRDQQEVESIVKTLSSMGMQ